MGNKMALQCDSSASLNKGLISVTQSNYRDNGIDSPFDIFGQAGASIKIGLR